MDEDEICQSEAVIPEFITVGILAVIFAIGAIGNICTCLVIIKTKSLHTHTNYCLLALACSDLILLFLACPLEIYHFIDCNADDFQKFMFYIKEGYGLTSIIIICAFTVERWLAIRHPLRMNVKTRNFCWIFAFISVVVLTIIMDLKTEALFLLVDIIENETEIRGTDKIVQIAIDYIDYATILLFIVSYVIPVMILATMCYQIAASVSSTSCNAQTCTRTTPNKMRKLLVAVVLAFLICWSPHQIGTLLLAFFVMSDKYVDTILSVSACCFYLNCAVNPILYNLFSINFRRALLHMISGGPNATAKAACSSSVESNKTSAVSSP